MSVNLTNLLLFYAMTFKTIILRLCIDTEAFLNICSNLNDKWNFIVKSADNIPLYFQIKVNNLKCSITISCLSTSANHIFWKAKFLQLLKLLLGHLC